MVPRSSRVAAFVALLVMALASSAATKEGASATSKASAPRLPGWASKGFIAYRCRDEIWLMRPTGSAKRHLLTIGPSPQWDPAFSPRGRTLAFRGYYGVADGAYALYAMGTDGCGLRRLTSSIGGDPTWSPDGQWIAFDTSGAGEIWKVRPDGSGLTRLGAPAASSSPAWAPDGTRIAFVRYQPGGRGIWVMRAGGSGARLLHEDTRPVGGLAWSHDGTRIAFVGYNGIDGPSRIKVMKANGSHARTIRTRGDPWNPVWLPGDAGIAFLANTDTGEGLFVMHRDGSHVHRIASLSAEEFAWVGTRLPKRQC
jgi:dipeptidyl aminopeptidase/acylaminoacyl peptidase